jgi:hypothetical protein
VVQDHLYVFILSASNPKKNGPYVADQKGLVFQLQVSIPVNCRGVYSALARLSGARLEKQLRTLRIETWYTSRIFG